MAKEKSLSFEQALSSLETVIKKLESGEATLEESLDLFEQGVSLAKTCTQKLDESEKKIEILLEKNGDFIIQPFDEEE